MGVTNAERQARHKAKLREEGYRQFHDWLPEGALADMHEACERIRDDPDLAVRLYHRRSGRMAKHDKPRG